MIAMCAEMYGTTIATAGGYSQFYNQLLLLRGDDVECGDLRWRVVIDALMRNAGRPAGH